MDSSNTKGRSTKAAMLHAIAEELGCAPELVGVVAKELKLRKRADILHATQERIAQMAKQGDAPTPVEDDAPAEPKAKKERKPGLTLSQRRALLKLLDESQVPQTDFKALPYEHLTEVGYATRIDGEGDEARASYELTSVGRTRAESINPGYRVWASGESVAGDESRPVAGTHRQAKAEADAAKAKADAESEPEPVEQDEKEPEALVA